VGGEFSDEGLDGRLGLGDEGHVINKHRDDDPEGVPEEDIDRGVMSGPLWPDLITTSNERLCTVRLSQKPSNRL